MADMVQGEVLLAARARATARAAVLPRVLVPLNLVDRLYVGYFLGLGVLIFALHQRVPAWPAFLAVHALCLAAVLLLGLAGAGCWPWRRACSRCHPPSGCGSSLRRASPN
jgi:hypothetical protein